MMVGWNYMKSTTISFFFFYLARLLVEVVEGDAGWED